MTDDQSDHSMVLHHVRSLYEKGQKCKIAYNLAEGLSCYTQAIDEIESLPNPSIGIHRLRCDIYLDICDIYIFQYKWKKANEWKKKGLSLANGLQDEVRIAECLYRQSEIKIRLWNFNGALEDCTKALEMKLKCLDENDVRLADSYHQLGRIYCGQNMCDLALSMHDKSLQIRLLVLGHNHLHVADSYHGIGIVYKKQGKYDLSLSVHDKSLQIRLSVLGYHHPDVALIYNNIGVIYDLQGKYDEALSMYNKSLYIALPVFGENHPNVRRTRNNITRTRHKQQIQYNQSTSMTKKFVDSIAKLFTPNQTYNAATTASNNGTSKNPNLDIFQHVQDEDLQKKIYYNAYNKALNQGHCYNNLIRGMFIGPRNVGKSSIRKVFTQQVLVNNQSPTQVAENSDIMVETESYCIHNLEIYDWTEILDDNVKTVIQELAETSIDSQATINQQIVNIDGIDQLVIPDNLSEQNLQEDDASANQFHTEETAIPSKEIEIESESKLSLHQYYCSSIINQNIDRRDNNFNQYVKIWDFGGHAIYHVTYYPFISANSIYILVFNINQDINDKVRTRENESLNMTYLQAMQEWLTSIVASHTSQSTISVNINDEDTEYSLPIIILVASHGDCIASEEDRQTRFNQFVKTLLLSMPSYKNNIYSSGIIFDCEPDDISPSTQEQRRQCCLRLHYIIKTFVQSLPFIRNPIPIRWYIMATILNKSIRYHHNHAISVVMNQIRASRVHDIMTMQQIVTLSQECGLYESDDELKAMLIYLHDLGEVIYCDKVGDNGIIITNVDWLLNIFRSVIQLQDRLEGSLQIKHEYEIASQTGKLSRIYIDYAIKKFNLDETSKETILKVMEAYDILCSVRDEKGNNGEDCQYFVPYLLHYDVKPFDLSKYHVSDWLYIGYTHIDLPYLPDGIYYCLLSSCLKEWNNTKVQLYYQCAKYYLVDDDYYLIVKKEKSHIALQYCYQKINHPQIGKSVIDKVKNSIFHNRPQDIVKNKLISIVDGRMVRLKGACCRFYIKCSECGEETSIADKYNEKDINWIRCEYCSMQFSSQSLLDWMIYNEKLWIERWKDVKDNEMDTVYFDIIAKQLHINDLFRLGVLLHLSSIEIDEIKLNREHSRYDKVYKVLILWKNSAGQNADISVVIAALRKMKINTIANQVEEKWSKIAKYTNFSCGLLTETHL